MPQRDLTVHIIGDSRSLERAFKVSVAGSKQFSAAMSRTGNDAAAAAREVVAAEVRKGEALRREVALYRSVASSAELGSREQVVAARLASDAERRLAGSMVATEREARRLAVSSSRLDRNLSNTFRGAAAGSGIFRGLGRSLAFASAGFLGGAGLTAAIRSSISSASDLNEQINKTNVVFGRSAGIVRAWAKTTTNSLGISQRQAFAFAGTFGNLLVPMGLTRDAAAKMSVGLVKLAADLASFNNASPEDVLEALRSGLAGEIEPLRRFGIFLSQDRIKAEAFRLGLLKGNVDRAKVADSQTKVNIATANYAKAVQKFGPNTVEVARASVALHGAQRSLAASLKGSTGNLTQQQKAMATYSIILHDSSDAQGDFARTSSGLANQQRIFRAQIEQLQVSLGRALLPDVLRITRAFTAWLSKSENQRQVTRNLNDAVKTLRQFIGAVTGVIRDLIPPIRQIVDAFGGLKNTLEAIVALRIATWATGMARNIGLIGATAERSEGQVRGLRSNLAVLARQASLTIGITTLFKAEGDQGSKALVEKILGGGLVGFALGGPEGAVIGATIEVVLNREGVDKQITDLLRSVRLQFLTGPKIEIPIGTSLAGLRRMRDQIAAVKGQNDLMVRAMDNYIAKIEEAIGKANNLGDALGRAVGDMLRLQNIPRPDDRRGARGAGPGRAQRPVPERTTQGTTARAPATQTFAPSKVDLAAARAKAQEAADKAKQAAQEAFDRIIQGFQVGIQRAELTNNTRRVIAVLNREKAFLQQRLRHDRNNLDLQQQLLGVQAQINDAHQKQVEQLKQAADQARSDFGQLFQGPVLTGELFQRAQGFGFKARAEDFVADIEGQIKAFQRLQANLSRLRRRGAPRALIAELEQTGLGTPEGAQRVAALAQAPKKVFDRFIADFKIRETLIQRVAKVEMTARDVTIRGARIVVGRATGADRLDDRARARDRARQVGRATGVDRAPTRARTPERTTAGARGPTVVQHNTITVPAEHSDTKRAMDRALRRSKFELYRGRR